MNTAPDIAALYAPPPPLLLPPAVPSPLCNEKLLLTSDVPDKLTRVELST